MSEENALDQCLPEIPANYFDEIRNVTIDEYYAGNQLSADAWRLKYCLTEEEQKYPALVYKRVADAIAAMEQTRENQTYWANRWLFEMWNDWWKAGGSIMQGAGSQDRISLSNCTTISINDDSLEGIFATMLKCAKSAAYRQGFGVDVSPLRPRGAKVSNSAKESTGAVEWMKFIDSLGKYVGQKGRVPAMLLSIRIDHPDVEEFIECKQNLKAVQNANISVQITDAFMEAVVSDTDWTMSFTTRKGETISKTVRARDLMRKISKAACDFAEPGVQFLDIAQRESVTNVLGYPIVSTNACSEKWMHPDSTCVLGSVNVATFSSNPAAMTKQIEWLGHSIVRFLDDCVEYELRENRSPYPRQKEVIAKLREVGVGITNLHGWLFEQGLAYDSDAGIAKAESFITSLTENCWKASAGLGWEKGNCLAFDEMRDKRVRPDGLVDELLGSPYLARLFAELPELMELMRYMRNSQVMSIAPAGTLSLTFRKPAISSGIDPCIGFAYWRKTRISGKYQWYFVLPGFTRKLLEENGWHVPFDGESVLDEDGAVGQEVMAALKKHVKSGLLKAAHEVDPLKKVELMARFSKWVDSSISTTFNLPHNATAELVEEVYTKAWHAGVKAVAVYRDRSREGVIEFEPPYMVAKRFKAEKKASVGEAHVKELREAHAPERPKLLPCRIHQVRVKGKKYLVVVGLLDGRPYEVFAGDQEKVTLPSRYKYGFVERIAPKSYTLHAFDQEMTPEQFSGDGDDELRVKDLIGAFANFQYGDLTRLMSASLRYGVPIKEVTEQLEKSESAVVGSFGKALGKVLGFYTDGEVTVDGKNHCPNCHQDGTLMKGTSGCTYCANCHMELCG